MMPPSGDTTLQGLVSGAYTVQILDQNGCAATCSFQVEEPVCPLTATIVLASKISCFQANNGVLAAQAANGTGPFSYSWTGPSPVFDTDTLRALQSGTYALTVTDAIGCRDSATFLLAEPSPLAVSCTVLSEALTVGGSEGRARIAFSGGTGAIRIDWGGPQPGVIERIGPDSLIVGGLNAGTYALVFTDSNNCQETCGFSISDPVCAFQVDAQSRQPSCSGASDGQIVVIPSGGTGPYHYSWSTGVPAMDTLSNLPSGVFSVTATDAIGCKDSIQITLAQPEPLAISCTPVKAVGRIGGNDGEALIALGGGTAPYQVVVSGPNNNTFTLPTLSILRLTDLRAGTYAVEVTDSNGCTATCGFSLSEPPCSMVVSLTPTQPFCSGTSTGSLTPVIAQGKAPFVYDWSADSLDNQSVLNGIQSGTYSLTVTDSVGCTASNTQTINDPPLLDLQCGVPVSTTKLGGDDGSISVTVLGGAPPYQLILSGAQSDTIRIPAIGAVTLGNLRRGNYSLLLTDSNGCEAPACSFAIEDPVCDLEVALVPTHPSCAGGTDGRIQTQITSGSARYLFDWSNNILDGIANPSGLAAGLYSLTVTDLRGCKDTALVRLNAPSSLQIACMVNQEPTRPGGTDGIIQVQAGGGTGRLNIQLLGPGQGARAGQAPGALTISQLPGGNYRIILTDSLACTAECSLTLTPPPCMLSATAAAVNPSCAQDSTGSIQIQATGQNGALNYAWNTGDTLQVLSQLKAGIYTVTIVDEALCRDTVPVVLTSPPVLVLNANLANSPTGLNRDDARVALIFFGGRGPYQIQWSGPVSGQSASISSGADTLSGLPAGNYTFTLTDSLGCIAIRTLSIPAFSCNLAVRLSSLPESCEGASIRSQVTGNLGTVAFDWSDDALDGLSTLSNRPSGLYSVTVSDPAGCSASASITVETSGPIRALVEAHPGDCPGDPGSLTVVQIQGGKSPYSIRLNNGNSRALGSLPQTLRNLQPGSTEVVLASSDGCLFDTLASIASVALINLELGPDLEVQKGDTVELAAAVDFDPETILWSPETGLNQTNTLTPLASPQTTTTYLLRVTDPNGCPVEDRITLFVTDEVQVYFPSAFSPNGDQMNDFFTGFSGGAVERIDLLRIYDRWGEMLFETANIFPNEPESGWGGQFRNEQAKPGVYIFNAWVRLKGGSTRFVAGEVLLVR
ncbi:MAG: gliding motility-associated C-terminal domain-containing protein [Haliscomenobacter sp.]|nr:gliding motility-associated C-terminal domain-containing protein [Haliscomenobacter sp.]